MSGIDPFGVARPDLVSKANLFREGQMARNVVTGAKSIRTGLRSGLKGTNLPMAGRAGQGAQRVGGAIRAHPMAVGGGLAGAGGAGLGGMALRPRRQQGY